MRRFAFGTIRGRLFVLVLAVAVPLLALLTWGFAEEVEREHRDARDIALRIARSYANEVTIAVDRSRALLARMAQRPRIRDAGAGECDSLFAIADFFPQYPNLLLYDREGRLICSANPQPRDVGASDAAELEIARLQATSGGRLPLDPFFVHTGHAWLIVSFLAIGSESDVSGFLALVEYFDMDASSFPPGTVLTIADAEGRVFARSGNGGEWIGKLIGDSDLGKLAISSDEGRSEARGIDGELRQYGFTRVQGTGWRVFVGVPTGVAMASVRSLLIRGLVAGFVVLVLVGILAVRISATVEGPLERLAETVERTRDEGFGARTLAAGPREIAVLGDAFNRMVERRASAEAALIESQRELEALSRRLLDVQEEERRRIAREIHDQLGQLLTALKMDIGGLIRSLGERSAEQEAMGARIHQALDETITSVRRLASELRPAALDDFGLVAAIQSDVRAFEERTGIECELSTPDGPLPIDPDSEAVVYRIVQEAMTNVARHSNASRVEIRIRIRSDDILVEVRDDGLGFRAGEPRERQALGIAFMRERARGIAGELEVEGVEGKGTIVSLRLPLRPAATRSNE
ncbi:MAG: histidine kinase [Thermoanaerobaculia bacterium]